ncbi:MAG TPA: glycoside hydrolase family 25 protein [Candidatus Limnocylindrales bacterium]
MRLDLRPRLALLGTALAASVLLSVTLGAGLAAAASTDYVSKCPVNLRSSASTSGSIVDVIATSTLVTASGTVSGSSWSADCGGSTVSGSSWYSITAINGKSTSTLYGKSAVYAATGLFAAAPPPPSGSWLEGIDVSHWQGTINWASVAAAGKKFAIIKATESTTYFDDKFSTNHAAARANGLRTGAYHFAQPSTNAGDAVAEADWFVGHMNLITGDLPPALDLEVTNGLSVSALQAWVKSFLDEVYAKTGVRAMVYTSPAFWRNAMGDTASIANAGYTVLWIAHWGVTSPSVPASNWGGKGWTFWQYSSNTPVPGISGNVDHDRYNGTDLTRLTYKADFAVAASPTSASVKQGASTAVAVSLTRTYFTLPVALSVSGAPAGMTATLDTASVSGTSANVTVTTSNTGTITPTGTYKLTISGTANGLTRTATATVTVTDGVAPTVAAPSSRMFSIAVLSGGVPGRTGWSGTDAGGIASYDVHRQVNGGAWSTVSTSSASATSAITTWTFNDTYRFRVKASDAAGNTSAWTYGPAFKVGFIDDKSTSVHYSGTWSVATSTRVMGGTLHSTSTAGASATYSFTGAGVAWVASKGPTRGSARIYVDGVLTSTVSLYAASYSNKVVVFAKAWSTNGTHTIQVVCVGTAGHPRIDLDGFARLALS